MTPMGTEEWTQLVTLAGRAISSELQAASEQGSIDPYQLGQYAVMVESFRQLRGESFHHVRPHGIPTDPIYKQEQALTAQLQALAATVPGAAATDRFRQYLQELSKTVA